MKKIIRLMTTVSLLAIVAGCGEKKDDFKYTIDQFADLKVMRYQIPGNTISQFEMERAGPPNIITKMAGVNISVR